VEQGEWRTPAAPALPVCHNAPFTMQNLYPFLLFDNSCPAFFVFFFKNRLFHPRGDARGRAGEQGKVSRGQLFYGGVWF
jgi:hypothetical protein